MSPTDRRAVVGVAIGLAVSAAGGIIGLVGSDIQSGEVKALWVGIVVILLLVSVTLLMMAIYRGR